MEKDPFTFLNYFQALRLHPRTRELVEVSISDSKPPVADKYLFGLILAERSVIHIIKNDDNLSVGATGMLRILIYVDINMILNYVNTNHHKLKLQGATFIHICLPGMTEENKLNLFIRMDSESVARIVLSAFLKTFNRCLFLKRALLTYLRNSRE